VTLKLPVPSCQFPIKRGAITGNWKLATRK
jgi:hypothetical protein